MMLAQKLQGNIDGIEIDADCANQMQENVQASPWIGRITCMQGDARHHFFEGRYGLIVSNPPFHESQLQSAKLSRNLAWHSSELTLAELFNIVDALLEKGGQFSLLLPYYRLDEAMTVAAGSGLHASMLCRVRHSNKHPFTRVMLIYQRGVVVLTEQTMEIRDGEDYSADFASLLKDYYLFL
jgi:tRNA1Val (adenine37-N6)-methyltransferase